MYSDRIPLLEAIESRRNSRAILYVTGDRPGLETQVSEEVYDSFVNLLDEIGVVDRISLVLYTRGGRTLAAWSIVNLIKHFCDNFEVIVPSKARSAGTLVCLGAKDIIMTKQATLGPIDPSINTALNPQVPGGAPDARVPISVEAVNGFLEFGKERMNGQSGGDEIRELILKLSDSIHPHVLGEVYRSKAQIEMLGERLLESTGLDEAKRKTIVSFLCSESGSHDYSIHRREAASMGLPVTKPDQDLYGQIKALYDDFASELELTRRWNPIGEIGTAAQKAYQNKRCLVESRTGGSYYFATEGVLTKAPSGPPQQPNQPANIRLQDSRTFEGWKYEPAQS